MCAAIAMCVVCVHHVLCSGGSCDDKNDGGERGEGEKKKERPDQHIRIKIENEIERSRKKNNIQCNTMLLCDERERERATEN